MQVFEYSPFRKQQHTCRFWGKKWRTYPVAYGDGAQVVFFFSFFCQWEPGKEKAALQTLPRRRRDLSISLTDDKLSKSACCWTSLLSGTAASGLRRSHPDGCRRRPKEVRFEAAASFATACFDSGWRVCGSAVLLGLFVPQQPPVSCS